MVISHGPPNMATMITVEGAGEVVGPQLAML